MTLPGSREQDVKKDDDDNFSCLAIDMASGVGSVALRVGEQISSCEIAGQPMQSRDIYADISEVLDALGAKLADLDCIALGCGPGAFTGLRVAAAVAQALAYGAGLPVVRVSSLAALTAGAARLHHADCIAPCLDARMGEAYLAVYSMGRPGGWYPEVPDRLVDPGNFLLPERLKFFAAGPGWSAYPDLLDNHAGQIVGTDFKLVPGAADMLDLAAVAYRGGLTVEASEALPNYIRDKVTD